MAEKYYISTTKSFRSLLREHMEYIRQTGKVVEFYDHWSKDTFVLYRKKPKNEKIILDSHKSSTEN